ncbi:hypothetical protein SDC9_168412 [bioreactor metagenome]|uniref:Coenzyme PQQ synthesis protein D n=1 Tax=bioreactor metagenome TaxID=1076179 RepID=A0A645GAX2_9ZZZZ
MLDVNAKIKLAEGIALYNSDKEQSKFYVFNTLTGDYFSTNIFGFTALSLVDENKTVAEILQICSDAIKEDKDKVQKDILSFLEKCLDQNVIGLL